jgi:hypothetical protein
MFKLKFGVVLGIVLLAATAWGSPLTVTNFSFESPIFGTSGVSGVNYAAPKGPFGFGDQIGGIPGWTITSGASTTGLFEPNSTLTPFTPNVSSPVATGATGVPNGVQVGFLMNGGNIFQDLTPIPGDGFYSVSMDVGHRTDIASGAYSILLSTSGGTSLATFTGDVSTIASGAWALETVTYSGAAIPVGQSLRLTLTAAGGQVAFDNVLADGETSGTVPEIGGFTVFWTMFGVAGIWIYRKNRSAA